MGDAFRAGHLFSFSLVSLPVPCRALWAVCLLSDQPPPPPPTTTTPHSITTDGTGVAAVKTNEVDGTNRRCRLRHAQSPGQQVTFAFSPALKRPSETKASGRMVESMVILTQGKLQRCHGAAALSVSLHVIWSGRSTRMLCSEKEMVGFHSMNPRSVWSLFSTPWESTL